MGDIRAQVALLFGDCSEYCEIFVKSKVNSGSREVFLRFVLKTSEKLGKFEKNY